MGDGAWQTAQEDVWNSEPLSRQPLAWGTAVSPDQEHGWVQMALLVCEQRQQQPELWGGSWGLEVVHGVIIHSCHLLELLSYCMQDLGSQHGLETVIKQRYRA